MKHVRGSTSIAALLAVVAVAIVSVLALLTLVKGLSSAGSSVKKTVASGLVKVVYVDPDTLVAEVENSMGTPVEAMLVGRVYNSTSSVYVSSTIRLAPGINYVPLRILVERASSIIVNGSLDVSSVYLVFGAGEKIPVRTGAGYPEKPGLQKNTKTLLVRGIGRVENHGRLVYLHFRTSNIRLTDRVYIVYTFLRDIWSNYYTVEKVTETSYGSTCHESTHDVYAASYGCLGMTSYPDTITVNGTVTTTTDYVCTSYGCEAVTCSSVDYKSTDINESVEATYTCMPSDEVGSTYSYTYTLTGELTAPLGAVKLGVYADYTHTTNYTAYGFSAITPNWVITVDSDQCSYTVTSTSYWYYPSSSAGVCGFAGASNCRVVGYTNYYCTPYSSSSIIDSGYACSAGDYCAAIVPSVIRMQNGYTVTNITYSEEPDGGIVFHIWLLHRIDLYNTSNLDDPNRVGNSYWLNISDEILLDLGNLEAFIGLKYGDKLTEFRWRLSASVSLESYYNITTADYRPDDALKYLEYVPLNSIYTYNAYPDGSPVLESAGQSKGAAYGYTAEDSAYVIIHANSTLTLSYPIPEEQHIYIKYVITITVYPEAEMHYTYPEILNQNQSQ